MKTIHLVYFAVILIICLGIQYVFLTRLTQHEITAALAKSAQQKPLVKTAMAPKAITNTVIPTKRIEQIVHSYLVNNPEVLIEVSNNLQQKQQAAQQDKAIRAIRADKNAIFEDSHDPVAGNPKGRYVLVEFYDYRCGHCKAMYKEISSLLATHKDIKFILKELPIFGGLSKDIATMSLAAYHLNPAKFYSLHQLLMTSPKLKNVAAAYKLAVKAGYNEATLKAKMSNVIIKKALERNFAIAKNVGINGTPALILATNDYKKIQFIPGRVSEKQLSSLINKLE